MQVWDILWEPLSFQPMDIHPLHQGFAQLRADYDYGVGILTINNPKPFSWECWIWVRYKSLPPHCKHQYGIEICQRIIMGFDNWLSLPRFITIYSVWRAILFTNHLPFALRFYIICTWDYVLQAFPGFRTASKEKLGDGGRGAGLGMGLGMSVGV